MDRRTNPQPKPLRDRRHELVRTLHERWDGSALGFGLGDLFVRGVLNDEVSVDARRLIDGWPRWPVYLRPRTLHIREYAGLESAILGTPPVRNAHELRFYEVGEPIWEPPYPPDSDPLLTELCRADVLHQLRQLVMIGVRPSRSGMMQFTDSPLASRLPEFVMSYSLSAEHHDEHRVEADQPPAGALAEAVNEFVSEFADRLPP